MWSGMEKAKLSWSPVCETSSVSGEESIFWPSTSCLAKCHVPRIGSAAETTTPKPTLEIGAKAYGRTAMPP